MQCYTCTYNQLDSSNSALDFVLSAFQAISDEHCKLENENDYHEIAIRNCPSKFVEEIAVCDAVM